jgi:hypothetical protein
MKKRSKQLTFARGFHLPEAGEQLGAIGDSSKEFVSSIPLFDSIPHPNHEDDWY